MLPNLVNADPDIMKRLAAHDPDNLYAVPYMWSTVGLGFNVKLVRTRLHSEVPVGWGLLFDPASAAKLKDCGISIIDSPLDVFQAAMIYAGRDPNPQDPKDVAAAAAILMKIRSYVRYVDPAQYIGDLANGELCLSLGWSGDIGQAMRRAKEAATGADIAYLVPREGALLTADMMAIPADAPHPHNAEIWLNYLMRPDVMAEITNHIRYPNGYSASRKFVKTEISQTKASTLRSLLVSD